MDVRALASRNGRAWFALAVAGFSLVLCAVTFVWAVLDLAAGGGAGWDSPRPPWVGVLEVSVVAPLYWLYVIGPFFALGLFGVYALAWVLPPAVLAYRPVRAALLVTCMLPAPVVLGLAAGGLLSGAADDVAYRVAVTIGFAVVVWRIGLPPTRTRPRRFMTG